MVSGNLFLPIVFRFFRLWAGQRLQRSPVECRGYFFCPSVCLYIQLPVLPSPHLQSVGILHYIILNIGHIFHENHISLLRNFDISLMRDHEILVKCRLGGICRSFRSPFTVNTLIEIKGEAFSVACTRLYTPLCRSVRRSVGPSVRRLEITSLF